MVEVETTVREAGPAEAAGWRLLPLLVAAVLLAYWPVVEKLVHVWFSDEDMAHGVFVPLVAGYAVWQNRARLARLEPGTYPWGIALSVAAGLMRVAGGLTGEATLSRIGLVVALAGAIHLFYGRAALGPLAFVYFLLLFGIPVPKLLYSKLTLMLQTIASVLSEHVLEMSGHTVIRQGNILELAGQKLSVAEACSGIRSLFSLSFLMIAYLYLHEDRSARGRLFAILVTVPVAIAMNALRIVVTAILGSKDPELAHGVYHATAGWVLSFAGFMLVMGLHTLFLKLPWARRAA